MAPSSLAALLFRRLYCKSSVHRRSFAITSSDQLPDADDTGKISSEDDHLYMDENSAAELELKRNKSRLKPWIRRMLSPDCDPPEILFDYQTTLKYRQRLYARYGRASGIDPTIMWPSVDEHRKAVEMEQALEPDLHEMMAEVARSAREEQAKLREREAKVDERMGRLDGWMADLQARKAKKIAEVLAIRAKRQRLVDEVSQYFGYKLTPKDPKFQEILEKKEKEERKAEKEARKTEKMAREVAKLNAMAAAQVQATTASAPESKIKDTSD